jgi:N-methylhydantoinase A/oxoprolinase/acetone carboxylase beta subunit
MLGTTHAANAVLERRDLGRVAVVRIGGPATRAIPPLTTGPSDLRAAVSAGETIVEGGVEFDGREIAPLDRDAVQRFLEPLAGTVDAVAITSVFAVVREAHELEVADLAQSVLGGVQLSLSHEIGTLGLLERENATVLNAALTGTVSRVAHALEHALAAHQLTPSIFLAQNDGTLMALDYGLRYPILTISSGQTNSIRGAAYLSGVQDAVVVDVGGSSTDVGMLINGFPRESTAINEICGVATNFRMPDIISLPLGGGTVVSNGAGPTSLGSMSIGSRVSSEALVFGGSTPTLTDAAVAAGRGEIGDAKRATGKRRMFASALEQVDARVAAVVDAVKLSRTPCALIAVGGGSFIIPDGIPGITEVIRPEHHEVANAIGAVVAAVGGQVDRIVDLVGERREEAIERAYEAAVGRAVRAGADPARVELVEREEIPLAYLTHPAVRIRIKVAGPLGSL